MKRWSRAGVGWPRSERGFQRIGWGWIILIGMLIAALVYCCFLDEPDDDDSGPSSKYVKFKNRGGKGMRVLPGMDVDWSGTPDGSSKDGVVKHGFAEIPDGSDATGGMNVTVPPFAKSYVLNFELEDGTKFVNAPCICPMQFGGLDIRMVTAELKSRDEEDTTFYWLEFEIEYDDYYDWPQHPPNTGLTAIGLPTEEVEAGTTKTWP